jgi:LysM repeat protein
VRSEWRRYAAPAAFLLAVTIAVVLIRSGINHGKPKTPPAATPVTTQSVTTTPSKPEKRKKKNASTRRYYTVQAGDTFSVISSKTGVTVATIARLNPKASSTSLFIGEKIRIR